MKDNLPLVTICIPTYNAQETVQVTLDSILSQTYSNIVVKVFDNCSTDNTANIIKDNMAKYSNLQLIINDKNLGGEGNFTKCLQSGEGKYTAIFHSDDIYHPLMIEKSIYHLEQNPELVAISTKANTIDMSARVTGERFTPYELRSKLLNTLSFDSLLNLTLKYGNFITCPSVVAKTEVYKTDIKTWNGSDFKTSADLDVWLRLSKIGPIGFLNEKLINYRVAPASISYNLKKIRTHRHDIFLVLDHYLNGRKSSYYDFLELKDRALRTYNNLNITNKNIVFNPWSFKFLKVAFKDLFHLKLYLSILAIWFLSISFKVFKRA